jgi:hypothetical protein
MGIVHTNKNFVWIKMTWMNWGSYSGYIYSHTPFQIKVQYNLIIVIIQIINDIKEKTVGVTLWIWLMSVRK